MLKEISKEQLRKFIPIMFQGGSYGTYLIFCLSNINEKNIQNPFQEDGSAHSTEHNFLKTIEPDEDSFFIEYDIDNFYLKYHPVKKAGHSFQNQVERLSNLTDKSIILYPDKNHYLLAMNNIDDKVINNKLSNRDYDKVFINNLYDGWNVPKSTNIDDIDRWILREFLSYNIFTAFEIQHDWYCIDNLNINSMIVTTKDLLFNFENCIRKVAAYCGIEVINNMDVLLEFHKKQLTLQKHINKDKIVNEFIDNFMNDVEYSVHELSLIDESFIQHKLRQNNYEIQCDGMNSFPRNTKDLKKYVISK